MQRRTTAYVAWVGGLAALLVLAALYGPIVWEQATINAAPDEAASLAATGAPARQITSSLVEDQEALADLYAQVAGAVVNIQVTSRAVSIPGFGLPNENGAPLEQSVGSGFIYDNDGHIVTNNHVVEDAENVLVIFNNGYWAEADVVATDPQADLAVIRVTPPEGFNWTPLPLEEADTLRVGHTVFAIGNPFGLDGTMTTGIVSALGRGLPVGEGDVTRYTLPDVIQTDAAINPGNSGGPLLDLNGRVVGVNFAIRSQVRANAGVGFAIPVSIVRRVVPALIADGNYSYSYLGLSGSSINAGLAQALELPDNQLGVYVATVIPGGPADAAGVKGGSETVTDENGIEFRRGGDIVIAIDDQPVVRFEDLVSHLVTDVSPGDTVRLSVLRGDEPLEISVVLGEGPAGRSATTPAPGADPINARDAIELATELAEEQALLTAEISDRVATPDEVDGVAVWVVELTTENEVVTVILEAETGDLVDVTVE
jgi:2-alkenal reductase